MENGHVNYITLPQHVPGKTQFSSKKFTTVYIQGKLNLSSGLRFNQCGTMKNKTV